MNREITLAHVLVTMLVVFVGGVTILRNSFPFLPASYYVFGLLLFLSLATVFFSKWYVRSVRLSRIRGREPISTEEIYRRYFSSSGLQLEVFVSDWRDAARCLELPADLLRPTDRFSAELKPLAGWPLYDDQIEHLFTWAARRVNIQRAKLDIMSIQTLGELITLVAN